MTRFWPFATRSRPKCAVTAIMVPVIESGHLTRIGRFGWKSQHASLVSFSADAYLNEMGITTPFPQFIEENPSNGTVVGFGIAV